ncbi:MAG: hypothetical protein P8Y80_00770 [Acidobacteriota bacterium]
MCKCDRIFVKASLKDIQFNALFCTTAKFILCYYAAVMKLLKILLPIFLITILFASDYKIKTVEVLPIESYPARTTVDDITIAADPYPNDEKSFTAFDVPDLNSRGYFPVHIIIKNSTPYYLKIQTLYIQLETRLGNRLYSTPGTIVLEDIIGNKYVDSLSRLKAGDTLSDKVAVPLSDFNGKELTNSLIDPGMVHDGFLFFFSEKNKRSLFIGSTLHIPDLKLTEEGTAKAIGPFTIQLDPALPNVK